MSTSDRTQFSRDYNRNNNWAETHHGMELRIDLQDHFERTTGVDYFPSTILVGRKEWSFYAPGEAIGDQDYWSQGPNATNMWHFSAGIALSRAPKLYGASENVIKQGFVGYELKSGEGFASFGLDAINDIIAEEAGRQFGIALLNGKVKKDDDGYVQLWPYLVEGRKFAQTLITRDQLDTFHIGRTSPDMHYYAKQGKKGITYWQHPILKQYDYGRENKYENRRILNHILSTKEGMHAVTLYNMTYYSGDDSEEYVSELQSKATRWLKGEYREDSEE